MYRHLALRILAHALITINYIIPSFAQIPDPALYSSLEYRLIGPFRGGRSCAVSGVPGKPDLFYFGSTGGGVWKTGNAGQTWENISDGYFGGSIGSIAVCPSDPNVIYVGGGEKTVRGNVSYGSGIWKSEDAGITWTSLGLTNARHIGRIRVHPQNPDIVYAAIMGDLFKDSQERGVYKSTDGGKTWNKTLFSSPSAGAVDLCLDPTNPRVIYASTWKVRRTPYDFSSGGEGSGLWKSTDSGETWTNISTNKGLPEGIWGISGVAVAYNNNQIVYAIIENENGGVFRSEDGGKTWSRQNEDRALRQRAWYYSRIYTDTRDDNTIYVVNVNYHKSTDGGKTFSSKSALHGDHHDLWIAPENPDRMIIGDDGGAQISMDGGAHWTTYHNQPTAQFYRVTTDNHFPYRIYAAQQDNSTIRIAHRVLNGSAITENDWQETAGGESAHLAVDPMNNDIVYGGSYGGFLTRVDHKNNSTRAINVWPDNPMGHGAEGMKYRFQWNFPIFFSRHNPKKLYVASNHLHVSEDEGHSWQAISPDLTRNEKEKLGPSGGPITKDNTGVEYYATIFAVGESPIQEGLIWTGSDDGKLHITKDGGKNWTDITPSIMPKYLMVNSVEPSRFAPGTCYIAGTMYKSGDYKPYIYKTIDYGKTWIKTDKGIPDEYFTRVVREDEVIDGLLYAGTEKGLFISFDYGQNWSAFQLNLPTVPITDLALKNNNLIIATQGRSLWVLDDLHVLHQAIQNKVNQKLVLFKPRDVDRVGGHQNKKDKYQGVNYPGGVVVHYFLSEIDEKKDTIIIGFMDPKGDTIRTFSNFSNEKRDKIEVKPGGNSMVWNLNYPPAKSFEGMILWWGSLSGPTAQPGQYTVFLQYKNQMLRQSFAVKLKPDSEGTEETVRLQNDFVTSIHQKLNESHQALSDMRTLKKQWGDYEGKIQDTEIKNLLVTLDSLTTEIEQSLYQTKNKSNQDPLNYPIRLTNKLAHLNSLIQMTINDFPPTQSMLDVRDALTKEIDIQLSKWEEIKTNRLQHVNSLIRSKNLDTFILENKP